MKVCVKVSFSLIIAQHRVVLSNCNVGELLSNKFLNL